MSKELKATPGPWKCVEVEFGDYQTGDVAFVVSAEPSMFGSVANCALIAAAPDLYVTLETVAYYNDLIKDDLRKLPKVLRVNIDNALAKARGEA